MSEPGKTNFSNGQSWLILIRAVGGKQDGLSRRWSANNGLMVPGSTWQQVPRGPTALRPTLEVVGALRPTLEVVGALQLLSCLVLFHQASKLQFSAVRDLLRKLSCAMNYSYTCSIQNAEPFGWAPKCLLAFRDSAVAKLMSALPRRKASIFLFT